MIWRWVLVIVTVMSVSVPSYAQDELTKVRPHSLWRVAFGAGTDLPLFTSTDGVRPLFSYACRLSYFPSGERPLGYWCDLHVAGFTSARKRISVRTTETTIYGQLRHERAAMALQFGVEWNWRVSCEDCWRPRVAAGAGVGGLGVERFIHVDGFDDYYPLEFDYHGYSFVSATASAGLLSPEIIRRVSIATQVSLVERYTRADDLTGMPGRKSLPSVSALICLVWDISR